LKVLNQTLMPQPNLLCNNVLQEILDQIILTGIITQIKVVTLDDQSVKQIEVIAIDVVKT